MSELGRPAPDDGLIEQLEWIELEDRERARVRLDHAAQVLDLLGHNEFIGPRLRAEIEALARALRSSAEQPEVWTFELVDEGQLQDDRID